MTLTLLGKKNFLFHSFFFEAFFFFLIDKKQIYYNTKITKKPKKEDPNHTQKVYKKEPKRLTEKTQEQNRMRGKLLLMRGKNTSCHQFPSKMRASQLYMGDLELFLVGQSELKQFKEGKQREKQTENMHA